MDSVNPNADGAQVLLGSCADAAGARIAGMSFAGSVDVWEGDGVRMKRVLFVCSANQLRSPLAEALFKEIVRRRGEEAGWQVGSAGVWALEGSPAALSAMRAASARGLDLSSHVARPVTQGLLEEYPLVLVMEREHLEALQETFPSLGGRIHLLASMAGEAGQVEDPVGLPFDRVRGLMGELERLLDAGWTRIRDLAGQGGKG